jgi:D-alanine-D-alanine ligase
MSQYGKVAVLMGGQSVEREVSLQSGAAILQALLDEGVDAHKIDVDDTLILKLQQGEFDLAFIALHGTFGEDGTVQGLLEAMKIPYTGSGVMASAIAMDKAKTKAIWQSLGLPVSPSILIKNPVSEAQLNTLQTTLQLPVAVKPTSEGSSVGVTKVTDWAQLNGAMQVAAQYGQVMVEQWVVGQELFVSMVGEHVLPSVRIQPVADFYDYHAKYESDQTQYFCPSGLSDTQEQTLSALAKQAYDAVDCEGWGRVDFIQEAQSGQFYLIELNTIPGMTSHSLVPQSAAAYGWSFNALVMKILAQVPSADLSTLDVKVLDEVTR